MKRGILFFGIYFSALFCLTAQINSNDTIVIKSIQSIPIDSVSFTIEEDTSLVRDSIEVGQITKEDSVIILNDTVTIVLDTLETIVLDTLKTIVQDSLKAKVTDSLIVESSVLSYDCFMNNFEDSAVFTNADTSYFVIHKINEFLNNENIVVDDTLKQAIQLLTWFYQSKNIKPVINYLENQIDINNELQIDTLTNQQTGSIVVNDSINFSLEDSLLSSVGFILNSLPEDSVKIFIINTKGDTVFFNKRVNELDSARINLYDNRDEFGVLWLKKEKGKNIHLKFEDGINIEKPKKRKTVKQEIDTYYGIPGLMKMKKVNIIVPYWDYYSSADIRFNQGYMENWAEGGENSMSALGIFKFGLNYSYGKLKNWENLLEYRIGYLKAGENPVQKNDDKLEFNSKYGKTAFNDWYYSVLLNFKTQILKGYDYPNDSIAISEFMSPAYLVFSLGLDYKPSKKLTVLISPLTSKFTIVTDTVNFDQTRFGLDKDEYIRKEIGAYVKAISKVKLTKKIELINKLNFFTNYADKPQNVDVDWEADLAIKLSDNIKVSVNAHIIYDDDVSIKDKGPKLQFKEMLGVGFVYTF